MNKKIQNRQVVNYIQNDLSQQIFQYVLGELLDSTTHSNISKFVYSSVENYIQKNGIKIDELIVICDNTNNTPEVIDNLQINFNVKFNKINLEIKIDTQNRGIV